MCCLARPRPVQRHTSWRYSILLLSALVWLSPAAADQQAEFVAVEGIGKSTFTGCPYYHPTACANPKAQKFLALWAEKVRCWLCSNQEAVTAAHEIIADLLSADIGITTERHITKPWLDTCLTATLLAMFTTTRSMTIQTWRFYEFGLGIIWSCRYDDAEFFKQYSITPTQIAYVFFIIGYSYWPTGEEGRFQKPELETAGSDHSSPWNAPLVVDIGMGLGADSRYYLSQGFRVVGVEANPGAVNTTVSDEWTAPFLRSGQLSVLHAAVAKPGMGGGSTSFYSLPHRPEMSNAADWVASDGGEKITVRAVECADLLRVFGRAVYMKIDIESNSVDCLDSLYRAHMLSLAHKPWGAAEDFSPPATLSIELEASDLALRFLDRLQALGYTHYKLCRQYVYSPAPCEHGAYGQVVPGCGSGPFGHAAVDYKHGVEWRSLAGLRNDTAWQSEFESGYDWFDLHVSRPWTVTQ